MISISLRQSTPRALFTIHLVRKLWRIAEGTFEGSLYLKGPSLCWNLRLSQQPLLLLPISTEFKRLQFPQSFTVGYVTVIGVLSHCWCNWHFLMQRDCAHLEESFFFDPEDQTTSFFLSGINILLSRKSSKTKTTSFKQQQWTQGALIYPDPWLREETSQRELLVQRAVKKHALQLHVPAYRLHVQMFPCSEVCDPVWGAVLPSLLNTPGALFALSSTSSPLTALCHRKISVFSSQGLKVVLLCLNL